MSNRQRANLLNLIMFLTALFQTKQVKEQSLHHHAVWVWMYIVHPVFCDIIKTPQDYQRTKGSTEWITPVREEMMGWEYLYKYKPQSSLVEAAFPTFIKWGQKLNPCK